MIAGMDFAAKSPYLCCLSLLYPEARGHEIVRIQVFGSEKFCS